MGQTVNKVDYLNPWKDIASYDITDADCFKGREEEVKRFSKLIDSGTMTVLYSDSGIGKTSFINAGISSKYIKEGYYPIRITFIDEVFSESFLENIEEWIVQRLVDFFENSENDNSKKPLAAELKTPQWIYPFNNQITNPKKSLWWFLHTFRMKDVGTGREFRPLIIFDQFEEVFSKTGNNATRNKLKYLFSAIEDISSDTVPSLIDNELEKLERSNIYLDFDSSSNYKIIFSLRKEFLADFDYWTNKQFSISELYRNRMLLLPLTREQAECVIIHQPDPDNEGFFIETLTPIKEDILNKIDENNNNEVEPIMLSVLCSRLYDIAISNSIKLLTKQDVNPIDIKNLISKFYLDVVNDVIQDSRLISIFEQQILDSDNHRNRIRSGLLLNGLFDKQYDKIVGDKTIKTSYKKELEDKHIIRVEKYNGEDYVEIIHDRVAEVISERKNIRKRRLANLKKFKSWYNILTITGRRLMDNCGFDFTEDNSRTIISGNSKNQLKNQSLSSIHSREYDGSDNVFVADILNQTVENDILFLHFNDSFTKDGFNALGIKTQLLKSQRIINGIEFYGSKTCDMPICSAEGFNGIHIDCDSDGNEKMRVYSHSKDGVNVSRVTCYEIVESDADGFPLKIFFKDANGKLCKHFDGNYGIEFKYDQYGNEEYRRYLDKDGRSSCKIYNQVYGLKSEYEEDRVVLQYFVDEKGNIITDVYGIVGVKYSYDENTGEISSMEYIGKDRKRCINPYGYSVVKFYYRDGKRYQNRYYAEDGKTPVNRIDGELSYSILDIIDYDKYDRIKGYLLRDIDESLKLKIAYTYNSIGHVTDTKYFAKGNSLGINSSGVHHIKYEYYENGLIKCQSHYGIYDSPIEDINGNYKAIFEWDDQGRLKKRHFYKSNNITPYNSQEFIYKSDAQCIVKDTTYIDVDGKLLERPIEEQQEWIINHQFQAEEILFGANNGFIQGKKVRVKYKYNIAGEVIEYRFLDPNSNEFIPDEEGNYGYGIETDRITGENRTLLLDADGNCFKIVVGNNVINQGEECLEVSYFDNESTPILCDLGYHKKNESAPYYGDEMNKKVTFLDCQGNVCNCIDGYAKQIYEKRNNGETEIRIVYFVDAENNPVINKSLGFHKREQIWSLAKNMETCRSFKDENDNLINVPEGFAKQTCKRYDSFLTFFYFPFVDHDVIRFYDKNEQKVNVDYEINLKGVPRTFHAYKYITSDYTSFYKVNNVSGKTLYRDWTIMWKCVFVILVPLAIIVVLLAYPFYYLFNKVINIFRPKKPIQDSSCSIIQVAEVFDEVQKGNESIVSPAKSMGIKDGCWIVKWNDWVYNKYDTDTIEKFEKEFNVTAEFKSITLYNPREKRFFNLFIREKNLGIRLQDAQVPDDSVNEMMVNALSLSPNENAEFLRIIYSNMARQYKESGEYDKAEELYHKQIDFMEQQGYGASQHDLADAYDDLGVCLFQSGKNNDAIEMMKKALSIVGISEDDILLTAAIHNHLAQIYRTNEQFEEAEFHYKESAKRMQGVEGITNDIVANRMMDIGVMLARQEKYEECIEETEKALMLTSNENSDLLQSIHSNLAYLYKKKGEYVKAEKHYREQIAIIEKQKKDVLRHDLADAYDDLGVCLYLLDRNDEAIDMFERALKIVGKEEGEEQLLVTIHSHFAQAFLDDNKYKKAEHHYKKCISYLENIEGTSGDVIADYLIKLGATLARQEKYNDSLNATERAVFFVSDDNLALLQKIHSNLAYLYKEKKEFDKAEEHYRAQIAIIEKQGEDVSPHTLADAYDDLGVFLFQIDRNSEAIEIMEHALQIIKYKEDEIYLIAAIHNHLAQIYQDNEDIENAELHKKEFDRLKEEIDKMRYAGQCEDSIAQDETIKVEN